MLKMKRQWRFWLTYEQVHLIVKKKALREEFLPLIGCLPPWMFPATEAEDCKGPVGNASVTPLALARLRSIWQNAANSDDFQTTAACLPPCTKTMVKVKFLQADTGPMFWGKKIRLGLGWRVQVRTEKIAYGPFDLLVEVGSSLGLWLGLSVLGLFDLIASVGRRIKSCFKNWM